MRKGICPDCGTALKYEETIHEEIIDEQYTATETYYCPKCGIANKGFTRIVYYKLEYLGEEWEES